MKDGGRVDCNVSPEYSDLFHSFTNAIQDALKFKKLTIRDLHEFLKPHTAEANIFFQKYLSVVTTPLKTPVLCFEPRPNPLKGMGFAAIGNFGKVKGASSIPLIEKMFTDLGGSNIKGRVDAMAANFGQLRHQYILLQDRTLLDIYEKPAPVNPTRQELNAYAKEQIKLKAK